MYTMDERDLMQLYAKLNAQDNLITICLAALTQLAPEPGLLEAMRVAAMDLADRQPLRPNEPNPEFGRNGQLLTLQMIAGVFDRLKEAEGKAAGND
ncbi:MAG: hypothetical protein P4M09_10905 [Devosia sp.]|nr:hypothetical protein [Devosia sp.]